MKINYFLIPLIILIVAAVGSLITETGLHTWYKTLKLPAFTPSGKTIGRVWSLIFALTAVSALIAWNSNIFSQEELKFLALLFGLNAVMNVFWSYLFFYLHMVGYAALEAAGLALSVLALIVYVFPVSAIAGTLLIPYFAWSCFATYLTYSVWRLNLKRQ